jgi:hypothetical protein
MNRNARRAAAKQGSQLGSQLGDLSGIAAKLQPYLEQIEGLKVQLCEATELLRQARIEHASLVSALDAQQELYFRLFAQGMGVPLDTIISMASQIQAQITQGENHGITDPRTPSSETPAGDSGASA